MLKICGDVLKGHPQKPLFLFPKAIFFLIPAQTKPPVPAIGFPLLFSLKKCVFESVTYFSMRRLLQLTRINARGWLYMQKSRELSVHGFYFPAVRIISALPCISGRIGQHGRLSQQS